MFNYDFLWLKKATINEIFKIIIYFFTSFDSLSNYDDIFICKRIRNLKVTLIYGTVPLNIDTQKQILTFPLLFSQSTRGRKLFWKGFSKLS